MNVEQFTSFVQRHSGLIQKVAYAYCRNPTDREDVIQEITMRLWRCRDRYDDRFKETTWIYRIAMNAAISFHRRENRHARGRVSLEDAAITLAAPADESNPDLELLMRCIGDLGALDKALVLLWLDGCDYAAIAEVLGISVSNVGTKLQRVLSKLRAAFDRHQPTSPTEKTHATQ